MTNIVQTNSVHKLLLTVLINMVLIGCTACSTKENYTKESQIINHIDEEVINNVLKSQLAYTYFLLQNEYIISKINNPNYYDEIDNRLEFIKRIKNTDYITYSTDESENNFKIYTKPTSKADVLKSA
ncbi:MAG: hypothetical protein AB2799_02370, partial [Candidatus Thiodiazotropha sp.]